MTDYSRIVPKDTVVLERTPPDRSVPFQPYRPGHGPTFILHLWDTFSSRDGKSRLAYRLVQIDQPAGSKAPIRTIIFDAADFYSSPAHAIDSDRTVADLMNFMTLRPGDTDTEYFEDYTPVQRDFCDQHAESLSCEVMTCFPDCEESDEGDTE